jgi:hypothetical protein
MGKTTAIVISARGKSAVRPSCSHSQVERTARKAIISDFKFKTREIPFKRFMSYLRELDCLYGILLSVRKGG